MTTAEESFEEHKMVVVLYDNTDLDVLELTDLQRILIDHDKEILKLIEPITRFIKGKIECEDIEDCDRCKSFRKIYVKLTELKELLNEKHRNTLG